jgi:hypothetical protein
MQLGATLPIGLTLSLSWFDGLTMRGEAAPLSLPKSSTLRQAQGEDFGESLA